VGVRAFAERFRAAAGEDCGSVIEEPLERVSHDDEFAGPIHLADERPAGVLRHR